MDDRFLDLMVNFLEVNPFDFSDLQRTQNTLVSQRDLLYRHDEFSLSTELLPYVLRLFQERYQGGFLMDKSARWTIYERNQDAE